MRTFSINEATTQAAFKQAGFSEIREIFENEGTTQLSSNKIRSALIEKYNFTTGQAAGTLKRACQKQLLFAIGNAEYVYNIDFPHAIAPYISKSGILDDDSDNLNISDNISDDISDNASINNAENILLDFNISLTKTIYAAGLISDIFKYDINDILQYHKLLTALQTIADSVLQNDKSLLSDFVNNTVNILVANTHDESIYNCLSDRLQTFYDDFSATKSISNISESDITCLYSYMNVIRDTLASLRLS